MTLDRVIEAIDVTAEGIFSLGSGPEDDLSQADNVDVFCPNAEVPTTKALLI
jgi:hypothetical protein